MAAILARAVGRRTRINRGPGCAPGRLAWLYRGVRQKPVDILELFDLQDVGDGCFLGPQPPYRDTMVRVYGGQVAGQAIAAAARTVTGRRLHSLHVAFLRPGNPKTTLHYGVAVLREGRTFSTRRVSVSQDGVTVMEALVSFLEPIDGDDFQQNMPSVPGPETLPRITDQLAAHLDGGEEEYLGPMSTGLVDLRYVDPPPRISVDGPAPDDAVCRVWLHLTDELPPALLADPVLAACMLAYVSDWTILDPVQVAVGKTWQSLEQMASLDHAMWFHRPVDFSDWLLYEQRSPSVSGGVGLGTGAIYNRDGTMVCTVTQEGYVGRRP
jgi:acyl-CoA thioesterase II